MAMASGTDPLDRLQAGARDLRAERELCHAAADRACRAESGEAFSTVGTWTLTLAMMHEDHERP